MSTFPEDESTHQPKPAIGWTAGVPAPTENQIPPAATGEPVLFQHWEHRPPQLVERIPHLGHCALLGFFAALALLLSSVAVSLGLHFHLYGVNTREKAMQDIHYTLGSELILYLVTFTIAWFVFPILWQKSFLAGVQWNGGKALRLRVQLFFTAFLCFLMAMLSGLLIKGPKDAPIDKILHAPGAPWLLFGFGVTVAPLFEEMFFRGFFLPALCTACDWVNEKINKTIPPQLDEQGHPRWSQSAMIFSALFTSLAFAAIHLTQTGNSWGSFALLLCVSLVLSAVRLTTRSLAASVLVHAAYNFLLFAIMLAGSAGFRQLDNL